MKGIEERVVELLEQEQQGLNIASISRILGVSRITLTNHIYRLAGTKRIEMREHGRETLCCLRENFSESGRKEAILPEAAAGFIENE